MKDDIQTTMPKKNSRRVLGDEHNNETPRYISSFRLVRERMASWS